MQYLIKQSYPVKTGQTVRVDGSRGVVTVIDE